MTKPLKQRGRYEPDLCSGAILPKLLGFALPLMCSSVLQMLFNTADLIVVGRWAGDTSLAAVGANTSTISLMVNFFIGLSVGANILAARYYGAQDEEMLRRTVRTSMLLGAVSGLLLMAAGICAAAPLQVLMKSPPEVRVLAARYLRIYFLGMPATMLYNFGAALLRAVGDTRRPLYCMAVSGVVNLGLNLLLVIVFRLDVAGVAIASAAAQYVSAALVLRCMMGAEGAVRLERRMLRFDPLCARQILRVGLPAGLQGSLFAISNVIIQTSVNSFGETVMAGNAAAFSIEELIFIAMKSFSQADATFTSQNLGAGKRERIVPVLLRTQGCVLAAGLALSGLAVLFGRQLLGVYSQDPAVIDAGMRRMWIVCAPYVLAGVMETMAASVLGLGHSVTPMLVTLAGACGFRTLWVALLFPIPRFHSIETVYLSYPISWIITTLAHLLCFLWAMGRLRKNGPAERTSPFARIP